MTSSAAVLAALAVLALPGPARASLVGHWPVNETSGTTAADVSGNGSNGTLSGGPAWTAGQLVGGLSFDGADDMVNAGSPASLDNLTALTVATWINAASLGEGSNGRIVVKGTGITGGWQVIINGTNQISFSVDYATTDLVRRSAANSVTFNTWCHVAVTWTGSATATSAKIYINGVETPSYAVTTNGAGARADDAAANFYIGNESGGSRTFSGKIDDVRVYNHVLTATEILALYQAGAADAYGAAVYGIPNRVSWWRLGETSGTTARDEHGTQNGTFTGGYTLNQSPLPVQTDNRSISLNGTTGYVSVPHNAAHSLATGSLAIWFKPTSLAADFGILSKNASGINSGEIYAYYKQSDNSLRIGFQNAGADSSLILPGKIQANVEHCLIIRWGGGGGFDAWLARDWTLEYLGAHGSVTGTLVGNSVAWSFGRVADIGATYYLPGTLDDVVLWSRRITDTEVQSLAQATADPLALVYPYTSSDNVNVSSASALNTEGASATPGRHIHVTSNISSSTINITAAGTANAPIVIRPNGSIGSRTFTNCTININGSYIVLVGFTMSNTQINLGGHHNRISRNNWTSMNKTAFWVTGSDYRVDHNGIGNMPAGLSNSAFGIRIEINLPSVAPARGLLDRNYLHDAVSQSGGNGYEALQIGSQGLDCPHETALRVEYNLISNWNAEGEVMSAKARGVVTRGNTVIGSNGRWGSRNSPVDLNSDWIENANQVRVNGTGSRVRGLRLVNTPFNVYSGQLTYEDFLADAQNGIWSSTRMYPRSDDSRLYGVIMEGADINVGAKPTADSTVDAVNTRIEKCERPNGTPLTSGNGVNLLTDQSGTVVQSTTTEPFTPAVKLTTSNVGTASYDPYHNDNGPSW